MKFFCVIPFLFVTVFAAHVSQNRDANEDETEQVESDNAYQLGFAAKDSHANTGNLAMSIQGMAQQKDATEQNFQAGFRAQANPQNRAAKRAIGISNYVECSCSKSRNQVESEAAAVESEKSKSKIDQDSDLISQRAAPSKIAPKAKSESDKSANSDAKSVNSNAKSGENNVYAQESYLAESKGYGNLGSSYGSYGGSIGSSYGSSSSSNYDSSGSGSGSSNSIYGSSSNSYGSPSSSCGKPSNSYGSSSSSYGSPSNSYGSPSNSYGSPSNSYGSPINSYGSSSNSNGSPSNSYGQSSGSSYVKPVSTYNQQILVQRPSSCKQTNLLWKISELVNESLDRARSACSNVENLARIRTLLKVALSQGCGGSNSYKKGDQSMKSDVVEKEEITQEKQSIALKSTNVHRKASEQNVRQSQIAQNERPEKRAMGSKGLMGQVRAQMNNNNRAHM